MMRVFVVLALLLAVVASVDFKLTRALPPNPPLIDTVHTNYLPLGAVVRNEPEFVADILEIIKENPLPPNVSEMVQTIKRKSGETQLATRERDYFRELASLAGPPAKCTADMQRHVLATLALAKTNQQEPALHNYVTYLKMFGQLKYGACAQDVAPQIQLAHNAEEPLDELFMAYLDAPNIVEDLELYQAVKKMDFVTDAYRARRMLKVAKLFMPNTQLNSLDHLSLFIQNYCELLQQKPLEDVLGVFNMARALGAQMVTPVSVKFLKLNEYNRVCLTWQEHRAEARANLERQLKASKWYNLNPKCLGGGTCLGD